MLIPLDLPSGGVEGSYGRIGPSTTFAERVDEACLAALRHCVHRTGMSCLLRLPCAHVGRVNPSWWGSGVPILGTMLLAVSCGARTDLLEPIRGDGGAEDSGTGASGGRAGSGGSGGGGGQGGTATAGMGGGGTGGSPACLPGEGPVELTSGYVWPFGIALLGPYVFFTTYDGQGALLRVPKSGGETRVIIDGLDYPSGVVADSTGIYVAVSGDGQILRTDREGLSVDVLASGQSGPSDVALDGSNLVWTNYVGEQIRSVPKAGGSAVTLTPTESSPYRLAVGPTYVYWGELLDGVWAIPKEGGERLRMAEEEPRSLETNEGWLYYTEPRAAGVHRMPLAGGPVEVLFERDGFADGITVDGTHVYATFADGEIIRLPKNGGEVETIAEEQAGPTHVEVDDACVYWTNTGEGLPAVGSVMRAPKQP